MKAYIIDKYIKLAAVMRQTSGYLKPCSGDLLFQIVLSYPLFISVCLCYKMSEIFPSYLPSSMLTGYKESLDTPSQCRKCNNCERGNNIFFCCVMPLGTAYNHFPGMF